MSLSGPLRGELSKYRKRKQLSLDGTVAGAEYTHYRRGYNRSPFNRREFTLALYDSRASHFQDAVSDDPGAPSGVGYDPDQQLYLGQLPGPQSYDAHLDPTVQDVRIAGSGFAPLGVHHDDDFIDLRTIDEQMQRAAETITKQEPVPFTNDVRAQGLFNGQTSLEERLEANAFLDGSGAPSSDMAPEPEGPSAEQFAAGQPEYDACLMTQAMFDQAMGQLAQPSAEPMAPVEPVEPDPFDQQRMMYDQQMQQLMDPYMMQGFGPGMMGPGFGPGM